MLVWIGPSDRSVIDTPYRVLKLTAFLRNFLIERINWRRYVSFDPFSPSGSHAPSLLRVEEPDCLWSLQYGGVGGSHWDEQTMADLVGWPEGSLTDDRSGWKALFTSAMYPIQPCTTSAFIPSVPRVTMQERHFSIEPYLDTTELQRFDYISHQWRIAITTIARKHWIDIWNVSPSVAESQGEWERDHGESWGHTYRGDRETQLDSIFNLSSNLTNSAVSD